MSGGQDASKDLWYCIPWNQLNAHLCDRAQKGMPCHNCTGGFSSLLHHSSKEVLLEMRHKDPKPDDNKRSLSSSLEIPMLVGF